MAESTQGKELDEPFGRQPLPVTVTISGDPTDIDFWVRFLMSHAEYKGDSTQRMGLNNFKIYPRAVND